MSYALAMLTKARPRRLEVSLGAPLRWLAALLLFGLAAMHGEFLLRRLADNSIAEPAVLLRWVAAAGLLLAAHRWRRSTGRSILTGRAALVFALLVALLHVGPPATPGFAGAPGVPSPALPSELLVLGLAGLWLAAALVATAKAPGVAASRLPRSPQRCRAPRALPFGLGFSPRPPPGR
jgi:hypothetical protein